MVFIRVLVAITGVIGNFLVIVAFVKNKNAIGQNFRYLNNVVLSLAIAGILYSVLGQPFDILYWYYNLSDIGPSYRDTGRTWIMSVVTFPQDIFEGAICFHVALIVCMRCLCLVWPLNFQKWHIRISTISIIGIYILLIFVLLYPTTIALHMTTDISQEEFMSAYAIAWKVVSVVTIVFPVLLNILFSWIKIFLLRKARNAANSGDKTIGISTNGIENVDTVSSSAQSKQRALEKLIKTVTVATIICYTPEVIYRSWFIAIVRQKKRTGTTGIVVFFFVARLSVQIASVIYPLIYATTIPKFKEIVATYLRKFAWIKYDKNNTMSRKNADCSNATC